MSRPATIVLAATLKEPVRTSTSNACWPNPRLDHHPSSAQLRPLLHRGAKPDSWGLAILFAGQHESDMGCRRRSVFRGDPPLARSAILRYYSWSEYVVITKSASISSISLPPSIMGRMGDTHRPVTWQAQARNDAILFSCCGDTLQRVGRPTASGPSAVPKNESLYIGARQAKRFLPFAPTAAIRSRFESPNRLHAVHGVMRQSILLFIARQPRDIIHPAKI